MKRGLSCWGSGNPKFSRARGRNSGAHHVWLLKKLLEREHLGWFPTHDGV